MSPSVFQLEWKGRAMGSFTLADIRARLASDEISRLHRVCVDGVWRSLGEWLDQVEVSQSIERANAEEQWRMERAMELESKRNSDLEERIHTMERHVQQAPPAVLSPTPYSTGFHTSPLNSGGYPRTSGLATASLVFGILNGVLFASAVFLSAEGMPRWLGLVGWGLMVSWVLSLVFGHLALIDIRRDELLRGRGLAIGGLVIGYAVVALISFFILIATLNAYESFRI